jgi:cyanate permease
MIEVADLVSKLTFPFVSEVFNLSNRSQYLTGAIFMCLFRGIIAETTNYHLVLVMCLGYGYFKALLVINDGLVVSKYCESKAPGSLPGALGLLMLIRGFCIIGIGQLLGWIRDLTGSYSFCLHIQNVFIFLVVVLWTSEKFTKCFRNKKSFILTSP